MMQPVEPRMRIHPAQQIDKGMIGVVARRHGKRRTGEKRQRKHESDRPIEHGGLRDRRDVSILDALRPFANMRRRTKTRSGCDN
jgi:hypothetical protein